MSRQGRTRRCVAAVAAVAASSLLLLGVPAASSYAAPSSGPQGTAPSGASATSTGSTGGTKTSPGASAPASAARLCATPTQQGEMACLAQRRTDVAAKPTVLPAGASSAGSSPQVTPEGFSPADLQAAYNLPSSGAGAGQTVAIVDAYDNPNAEADLAVYRAQYGLPPCTTANGCFRKVDQRGEKSYPSADPGWAGEIALDLDMVSAVCPDCHILLVEADDAFSDNLGEAVNTAVRLGAKYVSNSYGGLEFPGDLDYDTKYYKHPGVVVTASSGDSGYLGDDNGALYPSSSPYVTAVGGTSLVRDGSARGWSETAWRGAGSGCSRYEPKPATQHDPCATRTVADVSAVSDPATGVAVYHTYGVGTGWEVFGGTSVAAPVIASVYALAGVPGASDLPNSYPYASANALHDVTSGVNGGCADAYLCTAGPGYDGPTGLGTPDGLLAFRPPGPHGEISGTVYDKHGHKPLAGVQVRAGDAATTTDTHGQYRLSLPTGQVDVTASLFGYNAASATGVRVNDGKVTTRDLVLTAQPQVTVTGSVSDGSGHGWPLYADVQVEGTPVAVRTDPYTGRYQLRLPAGTRYTLDVASRYPGYPGATRTVSADADSTQNFAMPINRDQCAAPGYSVRLDGSVEDFTSRTLPDGWTVTDNNSSGHNWLFDNPRNMGNITGGTGDFAAVDGWLYPFGDVQDSTLTMPAVDLTGKTTPVIRFRDNYQQSPNSLIDVELSIDGGTTWTVVQHHGDDRGFNETLEQVNIPQAASKDDVRVRFHYRGQSVGGWWELDDVFVGNRTCDPVPGGFVAGRVTDANTGEAVNDATVTDAGSNGTDGQPVTAITTPTADDPALGGGFYWMFTPFTGQHDLTATYPRYATATVASNVAPDATTRVNLALGAGRLTITPSTITLNQRAGTKAQRAVTFTNNGAAPVAVRLSESGGVTGPLAQQGAPLHRVAGTFSPHQAPRNTGTNTNSTSDTAPKAGTTAVGPWTSIADYPTNIMDNAVDVGPDGRVYSVGGLGGPFGSLQRGGQVYDPKTGSWSALPDMARIHEKPTGAFVDGKLYVVGGWGGDSFGTPEASLEIYDPATNTWSTGTSVPTAYAASGVGVVNGKLYVVGGCGLFSCGSTDVFTYDPVADSWSKAADYPLGTSWTSCGTIDGDLYCAGGLSDGGATRKGFRYDASKRQWSPIADMPANLWGGVSAAANGMLLVSGGVNGTTFLTNEGYAYDPRTNRWSSLPNSNTTTYRSGGSCGMYKIGGSTDGSFHPGPGAEVLPGFDACGTRDVTWLSEDTTKFTVAPHSSVTVTLTVDTTGAVPSGTYTGEVDIANDSPYENAPVRLTLNVR